MTSETDAVKQRPQRWLITGVSSGLGRALAAHNLAAGDIVIGTLRDPERVQEFEATAPGRAIGVSVDVTDEAALRTELPAAIAKAGGVDVLVNNAGYTMLGAVEETSLEEARKVMETNFFGAMHVTQIVLPYLRDQRRGHVINVGSVASTIGFPYAAMYSASKSALAAFSDALAGEVAGFGVNVCCLEPGGMRTSFAGPSLASVRRTLPAYEEVVTQVHQQYAKAATAMRNDPEKCAAVVASLVKMTDPPSRLAIGIDGYSMIIKALSGRLQDYEARQPHAVDTTFEAAPS